MKIKRVEVWHFARQLDGRAWNPAFRWHERHAPLLVIECDDGIRGIGEAWSGYGSVASTLEVLRQEVAPQLLGIEWTDAKDIAALTLGPLASCGSKAQAAAWSAADIALWDVTGKVVGQPIWRLLKGTSPLAKVYASGGLYKDNYTLDDLYNEAQRYRLSGFKAMKMKIAGLARADDISRVTAVLQGLEADGRLWVDAVNQWTLAEATSFLGLLRESGVQAVQSPLAADDIAGLAKLNTEVFPVIAAEAEHRHETFHQLLEARAVTYLQFCLPLCGGFSGAAQLDDLAAGYGVSTTPQCFSTVIAQAATLHFAAARSNVFSAEYHCFHDHLNGLFIADAGKVSHGLANAGDAPGLALSFPNPGPQPDGSVITCIAKFR